MKDGYRLLVFPDIHFPHHDKKTFSAIYSYLKDAPKFDELLMLGDLMDFDYCSRWTVGNLRHLEGKRFLEDYEGANVFLDTLQCNLRKNNKNIKFTLLEGNHDLRPEKYVDVHPEMEGIVEIEHNLDFEGRGIDYHKTFYSKKTYKVGHAEFIHGDAISKYHASKMVDEYGCPIFYGHTHDVMCFPRKVRAKDKMYVGQSLGTLSLYNLDYIGHKPTNWQQCFTEFVFNKAGMFNYNITRIFHNKFIHMNGKSYE